MVGIHRHLDQGPWPQKPFDETATRLLENLQIGAELYCRFRFLHWKSAISDAVLSQTAAGLVITAADGRVTEINRTAEQIVSRGGGLAIRNGRLCTQRAFEEARLHKLIKAATAESEGVTAGCMLVGRHDTSPPYSVTVTPLSAELAASGRPLAMVIIANLEPESPSANGLGDLFGLSPRESQLAAGLLAGKTLKDIAASSGVRIATVRSQLSSVLRKVGVERQIDLVRLLTRAQMVKLSGTRTP
jgi:DNA-binding CsgD family transcriptional regulator